MANEPTAEPDVEHKSPFEFPMPWEPTALEVESDITNEFHRDGLPYLPSAASIELRRELKRYARRRTPSRDDTKESYRPRIFGRSFLVSGVRGAGKTQTVNWVIRDLQAKLLDEGQSLRLLPVLVSASTFLRIEDACKSKEQCSCPKDDEEKSGKAPLTRSVNVTAEPDGRTSLSVDLAHQAKDSEKTATRQLAALTPDGASSQKQKDKAENEEIRFRILIELCITLHRTVIREFIQQIRGRILERERNGDSSYRILDSYELLAQFSQDIEDYMPRSQLRDYWRRFRFLNPQQNGTALFGPRQLASKSRPLLENEPPPLPMHQGIEELNLLATLNEVFCRATGTLERSTNNDDKMTAGSGNSGKDSKPSFDVQDWKPLISGLLGGSLVGTGAANTVAANSTSGALFASIVGALAVGWISTLIPNWQRNRSATREDKFKKDLRKETLHREIPRLVDSLFQVGLCPVFIIDELDKIPNLYGEFDCLLLQLKQSFSEDGFFCFLTNRQFFDKLDAVEQKSRFAPVSTFFTNRVFIEFVPWKVREFVRDSFPLAANDSLSLPAIKASSESENSLSEERDFRSDANRDKTVLEYVIVAQAFTRMSTLHRLIGQYHDRYESGALRLGQIIGDQSYSRDLVEMAIEMAVEVALDNLVKSNRIGRERGEVHRFQHLLSIPRSRWLELFNDQADLGWSDAEPVTMKLMLEVLGELNDDLTSNLVRDRLQENVSQEQTKDAENNALENDERIKKIKEVLSDALKSVTSYLSNGDEFKIIVLGSLIHARVDTQLRRRLLELHPYISRQEASPEKWRFAYDRDGRSKEAEIYLVPFDKAKEYIRSIQRVIAAGEKLDDEDIPITTNLGVSFTRLARADLIGVAPAWVSVRDSLMQLEKDSISDDQRREYERQVIEFRENLRASEPSLVGGLVLASALGRISQSERIYQALHRGLDAIEKWVPANASIWEEVATYIANLMETSAFPEVLRSAERVDEIRALGNRLNVSHEADFLKLKKWLREDAQQPVPRITDELTKYDAKILNDLYFKRQATRQPPPKTVDEVVPYLLCEAAGRPTAKLLQPKLSNVTIGQWSQFVSLSLVDDAIPRWAAGIALRKLGFTNQFVAGFLRSSKEFVERQDTDWDNAWRSNRSESPGLIKSPGKELSEEVGAFASLSDISQSSSKKSSSSVSESANLEFDLIVCQSNWEESRLAAFHPLASHPCLCLPPEDAAKVVGQLVELKLAWKIRNLFLEEPGEDQSPSSQMSLFGALLQSQSRIVAIYRKTPKEPNFEFNRLMPKKLSELLNPGG